MLNQRRLHGQNAGCQVTGSIHNLEQRRCAIMTVHYNLGSFPPKTLDWKLLVPLVGQAHAALSRYDGLMSASPNPDLMLSPMSAQEAVLSSKIEGTTVTMSEALKIRAGADSEFDQSKIDDSEEVWNYCDALSFAARSLKKRSLNLHLLRETHELLMRGVRGRDKEPGKFRTQQNWIGPRGCGIEHASFVPIPLEHMMSGLERWMQYVSENGVPDPLVQLAIVHLEFEAIHPFMDGNGRLGRMIIPLYLYKKNLLNSPYFYMSGYLEKHRDQYIDSMRAVSRDGLWNEWCVFFLNGIAEQAQRNSTAAERIFALYGKMKQKIADLAQSRYAINIVDFLFSHPVFPVSLCLHESGIPPRTARRILEKLTLGDDPVVRMIRHGTGRIPAIAAFPELVNIVEGKKVL